MADRKLLGCGVHCPTSCSSGARLDGSRETESHRYEADFFLFSKTFFTHLKSFSTIREQWTNAVARVESFAGSWGGCNVFDVECIGNDAHVSPTSGVHWPCGELPNSGLTAQDSKWVHCLRFKASRYSRLHHRYYVVRAAKVYEDHEILP